MISCFLRLRVFWLEPDKSIVDSREGLGIREVLCNKTSGGPETAILWWRMPGNQNQRHEGASKAGLTHVDCFSSMWKGLELREIAGKPANLMPRVENLAVWMRNEMSVRSSDGSVG